MTDLVVRSFDPTNLDMCLKSLVGLLSHLGYKPALSYLPTRRKVLVVQSSPHVDKKGRNTFARLTHNRGIQLGEKCLTNKLRAFILGFLRKNNFEATLKERQIAQQAAH